MSLRRDCANEPVGLLTDLYELTMGYGYYKAGLHEVDGVFHQFFRRNPFKGGFTVACGLEDAIRAIERFRFSAGDLGYLAELRGNDGQPLFDEGYLRVLEALKWRIDVDAVPEGTVVFPHEPLVRVQGPMLEAQLLESLLLNIINFQSLVATKAARMRIAARGDQVLEFGMRRAQGIDGALSAARAAFIGGCIGSSDVMAGRIYGMPVRGTHAHSWVMCFPTELEAFETYASCMPNNCVFLVDTYDTLEGVRNAVRVGLKLRERGYELGGIRLDSGDLAYLSIEARKILDQGGFPSAVIVASNDLDELLIESLKLQGAKINVWGVGTKLVTAFDEPALGGVYKLAALRKAGGEWENRIKLSEQVIKTSTPGILQVRRFAQNGLFSADAIYDVRSQPSSWLVVDPKDPTRRKKADGADSQEDLLVPIFRQGERVYEPPTLPTVQARAQEQINMLHPTIQRFANPHEYPAGLELSLHETKMRLIMQHRERGHA